MRDGLSSNGDHEWSYGEFTALVDLTYLAGTGILNKKSSPKLMKAIEDGDYEAGSEDLRYTKVNGKSDPKLQGGMAKRSDMRKNIWNGED